MSYRCCTDASAPQALLAPTAVPPSKPAPGPTAAPVAGLPAAAPTAAPAAAPSTVPIAAPVTVLVVADFSGLVPVCCIAHCRHAASSLWNISKFFPLPGSTITRGPVGIDAHAVASNPAATASAAGFSILI